MTAVDLRHLMKLRLVVGRELITHDSVRRITQADADFAPILRDRVEEDVCAPRSWWPW